MKQATSIKNRTSPRSALPPGPRTPALIQGLRQLHDPLGFATKIRSRYGDVFSVSLPVFGRVVYVTSPEIVKAVFTGSPAIFHSGEMMAAVLEPTVGLNSVLVLDEEPHLRHRKLLLPPFHGERVQRYGELIREITLEEMESWPVGERFALGPHFQRIALAVIMKSIFGVHDVERLDRIEYLIEELQKHAPLVSLFRSLRRDFGRWSPWARFLRARTAIDEFLYELIEQRRKQGDNGEHDDVLSLLMQARHDDGTKMSDVELRDELIGIIGAGYETTTNLLAWTVERLLRTPRALERLRESISAGEDDYLAATVKEALRARPVVTSLARKLTAPVQIGDFDLDAGTVIFPAITALHYREDLFPEPEEFRPERFLDGKAETYSWIPFGGGIRRCIGAAFAEYEMRTVLGTVFERAVLRAPDQRPERVKLRTVTLRPGKGTQVILDRPLH
jgi:cytochrome P450